MSVQEKQVPLKSLVRGLNHRLTGISIQVKTTGIAVAVVLLLGAAVTLQTRGYLARELGHSLEERGIALARGVAASSTNLALTGNRFELYELIRDTVETNPDVRYAFVVDRDGDVLAHSFSAGVPPDLLDVNTVGTGVPYQVELLHSEEGLIYDVAVPLLGGRAGVTRVGLSETRLQASIAQAIRALIATTVVALGIGVIAAYLLARVVTKPVLDLLEVTRSMARGNLERKARHFTDDEIGELSDAFNAMTDTLARSRNELLRNNRELAALNDVIVGMSHSRDLREVLDSALRKTLPVFGASAGWIVLPEGERSILVAHQGLPQTFVERENHPDTAPCYCLEALRVGDGHALPTLQEYCPRLERARLVDGSDLECHLSIPLQIKAKLMGIMNIAFTSSQAAVTAEDRALLKAMGQQVGVAIENAQLWEQLKLKEAQRGQLLEQLMTAQEDERKRIARELHDEAGSSLTSLKVGLHLLEESAGPSGPLRETISELRETCVRTLEGLHRLSTELRPSALDRLGLIVALEQMASDRGRRWGTTVHFRSLGLDGLQLPSAVASSLYRIVQEALTNIGKHAGAQIVTVLLERRSDAIVLIVEDDGLGFDAGAWASPESQGAHLGLLGMRERATLLGGQFIIESAPNQGTTLYVEIPCGATSLAVACADPSSTSETKE